MKEDHREKAIVALSRFRKEVREAGFSEDELGDILGHVSALEDITHSPEVTNAVARVVRFFNSIGIQ